MKIGLLTRKLTTVYLLLALFGYLTVGCLRQPSDAISQSSQKSENPLIAAKNSSSFNYFEQKKKVSVKDRPGRVKLGTPATFAETKSDPDAMKPAPVKISQASYEDVERQKREAQAAAENKPVKEVPQASAENWRSKSLIASARKYPSKLMDACQQNTQRIQQASGTLGKELTQGFKRITGGAQDQPTGENASRDPFRSHDEDAPGRTAAGQLRAEEVNRALDQAKQLGPAEAQLAQLGEELQREVEQREVEQPGPAVEAVSQEMRRLQINSIMKRARRELKEKNYEYAQFLAEQALENSYRGHVAFGLEEESPQMLLQQIKQELASHPSAELKQAGHSTPRSPSNSDQQEPSFRPSRVHPLKRRAAPRSEIQPARPRSVQPAPQQSGGAELPLIVPRNMGTTPVQPRQPAYQQPKTANGSISLEPPAFGPSQEEPVELPPIEQPVQRETQPVPSQPSVKLELEEVPDEPPARVRLSGPEPAPDAPVQTPQQNSAAPAGAGPQLMLPKLPSVPGDQTSHMESNGKTPATMTSSVKVRANPQGLQPAEPSPFVEQDHAGHTGHQESAAQGGAGLKLDEIEWDLAERKRPARKSGWGGLTTLLLIAGGLIILLLTAIIVVLLRRGASSS